MIIVDDTYNVRSLRQLLIDHLDSGKLFVTENTARQIGKTAALAQVAHLHNIPVVVRNDEVAEMLNFKYDTQDLFFGWRASSHRLRGHIMAHVGYLSDEGVPLEFHKRMKTDIGATVRTGFFDNRFFN